MRALCCHGGSASLGSSTRCPVDAGAAAAAAQHVCLLRPLCRAPLGAPVRADGCAAALRVRVRFSCARREQQRVAARTANARPAVSNPNHLHACPHSAAPRFARVARCRRPPPQRSPIQRASSHARSGTRALPRPHARTHTYAHARTPQSHTAASLPWAPPPPLVSRRAHVATLHKHVWPASLTEPRARPHVGGRIGRDSHRTQNSHERCQSIIS